MIPRSADIPVLDTARLVLRAPVADDFAAFATIMEDARAIHMGGPFTRRQAWSMFCEVLAGWSLLGFGGWSVTARDDGRYLGEVALNHPPGFPEVELGWALLPAAEGHGFAAEAARAVRAWAARARGLVALVSYIDPDNARSIALAERLGAVRDPAAAAPEAGTLVFRHPAPEARA